MKHALSILVVLSWILNFSDCSIISHLNRLRPDRMTEDDKEDDDSTWSFFKNQHGRFYSAKDEHIRKQMFLNHTAKVREHFKRYEKGETSFFIGLNHFSDMSDSERNDHLGNVPNIPKYNRVKRGISSQSYRINSGRPIFYMYSADKIALPDSVDYRTSGWTEPVRYQGRCGSCWAFAVSSAMSYYVYAKNKTNYIFSPQNLIDCSFSYGNNGCGGGFPLYAYEYIKVNNITLEAKFPYRGNTGACNKNSLKKLPLFGINSFVLINSDQNSLKQAVAKIGAVVVGISAGNLFDYAGGIWDGTNAKTRAACSLNINHAVTVIGYGSASNKTYWIIKNSWGVGWGEGGYFRMLMNGSNLCGIYSFASTII